MHHAHPGACVHVRCTMQAACNSSARALRRSYSFQRALFGRQPLRGTCAARGAGLGGGLALSPVSVLQAAPRMSRQRWCVFSICTAPWLHAMVGECHCGHVQSISRQLAACTLRPAVIAFMMVFINTLTSSVLQHAHDRPACTHTVCCMHIICSQHALAAFLRRRPPLWRAPVS